MASCLLPGNQVMSDLLTIREKGVLFTLLEPQCKLIKATVAQVLVAKEAQGESPGWSCLGCGVMCLIEDKSTDTNFLRLYCVKRSKLLWEEELYIPFKYNATCTFFHTFPADGHHIGLNFANEIEAEEFHLEVESVQRNQEEMTRMSAITNAENKIKPLDHLDKGQQFSMNAPSTTVTPTTGSKFKDQDTTMRRLLMRSGLTEKDLKGKDITEAVDCIINQFGGLTVVQRELRNEGPVSQVLQRAAEPSISPALKKGPLPPVPPFKGNTTSQQTPQCTDTLHQSQNAFCAPPPPLTPAPVLPGRIRKSESLKPVGSSTAAKRGELILAALREEFRQKKMLERRTSADESQIETDTNSDRHL